MLCHHCVRLMQRGRTRKNAVGSYATPAESVKAAFDPSFYHQIQITSDGDGGEVTLKCTNYKSLNLVGATKNENGEYIDADCKFTAKITDSGVVKIILDKMPDGFQRSENNPSNRRN